MNDLNGLVLPLERNSNYNHFIGDYLIIWNSNYIHFIRDYLVHIPTAAIDLKERYSDE